MILERLAKRLLKCPFDEQVFVSGRELRLHLCECHTQRISSRHRVARQDAMRNIVVPERVFLCAHCLNFVVPADDGQNEMVRHIRVAHPSPFGPIQVQFFSSTDSTLIGQFVEAQTSHEVYRCAWPGCAQVFTDDLSVALHWAEEHCGRPTVEEVRRAIEQDSERFTPLWVECASEIDAEEGQRQLTLVAPDDGYVIHHSPSVPRVRSKPGEHIVYVEREPVRLLDRELEEMLECEGLTGESEPSSRAAWAPDDYQTVHVDLRFCNILDGYLPLVKDLRRILPFPPLADGETIDVSWQGEPENWFPCKVSRSKRAIYNLDGRLRQIFSSPFAEHGPLPSGVRLYVTRIGPRRYLFWVKRAPHVVRDCKSFIADDRGGWAVDIRDELIEWETGDHILRHQLTFEQMEALRQEARRTNLSVRDSTYEAMRVLATTSTAHVLAVYDFVFLRLRTCSLAAVWAQFRPEHACYVRVQPGWYRFDPAAPFPTMRFISPPPTSRRERLRPDPNSESRYRVKQRTWRHNVYQSRLEHFQVDPDALLEVRCAFGTIDEVVFVIPIPWLMAHVIPRADCNERGQYLFSVNQRDYVFTWDHGVRMEGKSFLQED